MSAEHDALMLPIRQLRAAAAELKRAASEESKRVHERLRDAAVAEVSTLRRRLQEVEKELGREKTRADEAEAKLLAVKKSLG